MKRSVLLFATVTGMLATTLLASKLAERGQVDTLLRPLSTMPAQLVGWRADAADDRLTDHVLEVLVPTDYLSRGYRKGGNHLGLFIAFYAQQRAGENMHSPKHCLPGSGWDIWDYGSVAVPVQGATVTVNRYSIQNNGERAVVLYWYQSRDRVIASEYVGKVLLVRDAVWSGRTSGSLVRIVVPDRPGMVEEAVAFASAVIPELHAHFRP